MRTLAVVFCLVASVAAASPPELSQRPAERPARDTDIAEAVATAVVATRSKAAVETTRARTSLVLSPRPEARPENLRRRSTVRAAVGTFLRPPGGGSGGAICGSRGIRGDRVAPIVGRIRACAVAEPMRVTSVGGLRLSQPAIIDCPTARALERWVERGVKPAIGRLGGGAAGLRVAAHYSCRTRNNQPGAKVSEHGKARAIDISGIELRNGQTLTVLRGWPDPQHGRRLRAMHASACGTFGTVLGPGSDGYHRDHFHFDTARYRSGSYCR